MKFKRFHIALFFIIYSFSSCVINMDMDYLNDFPDPLTILESDSIEVSKVIVDIPYGDIVGFSRFNGSKTDFIWKENIVDNEHFSYIVHRKLEEAGFDVDKDINNVFVENDNKPRYQLAAVINDINIETSRTFIFLGYFFINTLNTSLKMDVDWVLYDRELKETVSTENIVVSIDDVDRRPSELYVRTFEKNIVTYLSKPNISKIVAKNNSNKNLSQNLNKDLSINYTTDKIRGIKKSNISNYFNRMVMLQYGTTFGSGVIISEDGYILTAAHVVSNSDDINVKFYDGTSVIGHVVAKDVDLDAAIIKVRGKYKAMPLSLDTPSIGEDVFVVGNPMSKKLNFSLTTGVISGLRHIMQNNYIQTDTAINPGNSGGPMIDSDGRVIGIVVLGQSNAQNISLALQMKWVIDKLNINKLGDK